MALSKSLIVLLALVALNGVLSVETEDKGFVLKASGKIIIKKGQTTVGSGSGNDGDNDNSGSGDFVPNKCPVGVMAKCTRDIVPGCAGFKNGTYAYLSNGNRCTQCFTTGTEVVSFNENEKCPKPAFVPNKCPVGVMAKCTRDIVPGCAGFKNGTYAYLSNGNRCTQCFTSNSDVVSFNENEKCPGNLATPEPPVQDDSFVPSTCPANPASFCTFNIVPGCAGYKNGTYAYLESGNKCTQCQKKDVVSFNEGEKCPAPEFVPNRCPVGVMARCTTDIVPGCTGFKNGTYAYLSDGNRCIYCLSGNPDVVSFNENEKCPFVPNKCPDTTLIRFACTRDIVPGCAGFKDGSFKYLADGNRCTQCYKTSSNVVSFNENEQCPN